MSLLRWLLAAFVLFGVALLLWLTHPSPLQAISRWLDVGERPRRSDYLMVLCGGECTRPFVAAALFKAGFADRVLVAESARTPADADRIGPSSDEIDRLVLLKRGVAEDAITMLPAAAVSTRDEVEALAVVLRKHPQSRAIVVTSDYHTRRSWWVLDRVLGEQAARVSFVSAPSDEFRMDNWWQDESGFVCITSEYLKLAAYIACYGYMGHWLAACIGLALVAKIIRSRTVWNPSAR